MKRIIRLLSILGLALLVGGATLRSSDLSNTDIRKAFARQGIRMSMSEVDDIRDTVLVAVREARQHGIGNSKVDFSAVEIAELLDLDTSPGSNAVQNVVAAIGELADQPGSVRPIPPPPQPPSLPIPPPPAWDEYFDASIDLWRQRDFLALVGERGFQPVKISWEDIGRHEGSVWGDRISDVGIWVRRDEFDPRSARLALSVRRDSNFRDKILMVPADEIKIHQRFGRRTVEKTLPERLRELGLSSRTKDRNVIVSNQFAIVPVPSRAMRGAWPEGVPPRSAFTFSIFPYGSTNFVITDVIEGSHEAIVGPGQHQLLFANVDGERAPFTASRAEDRPDLLRLERDLRRKGMDVDVQRYYLIQVPLRRDRRNIRLSNMGTPPFDRPMQPYSPGLSGADEGMAYPEAPSAAPMTKDGNEKMEPQGASRRPGLSKVAIGHGEPEGRYFVGDGYRGARAEEPIRVTVVYFVTPVGRVTRKDMETFSEAFESWDSAAIWGGSFVTKESD